MQYQILSLETERNWKENQNSALKAVKEVLFQNSEQVITSVKGKNKSEL